MRACSIGISEIAKLQAAVSPVVSWDCEFFFTARRWKWPRAPQSSGAIGRRCGNHPARGEIAAAASSSLMGP